MTDHGGKANGIQYSLIPVNAHHKKSCPLVSKSVQNQTLPKLGWVMFAKSREVEGKILSATICRNPTGKYFISIDGITQESPTS